MIYFEITSKIKKYFLIFAGTFSFLFLYNIHQQYIPTGDEIHVLIASYSLAIDGDFDLKNNYDSGIFYSYAGNDRHIVQKNGKELPFHSATYSAFFYPVIKLYKTVGNSIKGVLFSVRIFMNILWAFAFVLLYDVIFLLIDNKKIVNYIPFIVWIVPAFLIYGSSAVADSMAFVLMAALINLLYKIHLKYSVLKSVIIALLCSLLFFVHPRFSIISFWAILVVFHAYFSSYSDFSYSSIRRIFPFVTVGLLFIVLKIIINYNVYDTLSVFGAQEKIKSVFSLSLGIKSLPHTLFDGWQGLIGVFPIVLIGMTGSLYFKSGKILFKSFLVIILAQLIINGSLSGWEGNAVYWGGRFNLIFLGYFIIAFFVYIDHLINFYDQNGFKSTLPLILLVLIPVFFQMIQLYYVVVSDGFGFSAQIYGPWSDYFPQFFKNLNKSVQYQKSLIFLIIYLTAFIGLLNVKSIYFLVFNVLLISGLLFNYSFIEKLHLDNLSSNYIIDNKREVVEWSGDIYLPFDQEGKWQIEFIYGVDDEKNLKENQSIAAYSIIRYRGRKTDVFSDNVIISNELDPKKNKNQRKFTFIYPGVGACFFRIYKFPNPCVKFLLYSLKIKKI